VDLPLAAIKTRTAFLFLLFVALALFAYVIFPFRTPLFLAAVLSAVLKAPLERTVILFRGRRRVASAVIALVVLVVLVAPFISLVAFVTQETVVGLAYLRDTLGVHSVAELRGGALPRPLQMVVEPILSALHLSRDQISHAAGWAVAWAQDAAPAVLASGGRAVVYTLVMLVALYFLLLDGRALRDWLWRVSPLSAAQMEELSRELSKVTRATVLGTIATASFQGLAAGVGYAVLGVPHAAFFGLLTALVSFVPGIGTALVWGPAAATLWFTGHSLSTFLLIGWCLVVVVGAEQIGKPILLRGQVEMHTGLIFLALLGGLAMFGLLGIILGPLTFAFFLTVMRIYARDFSRA